MWLAICCIILLPQGRPLTKGNTFCLLFMQLPAPPRQAAAPANNGRGETGRGSHC
jgi:hypothetical protein